MQAKYASPLKKVTNVADRVAFLMVLCLNKPPPPSCVRQHPFQDLITVLGYPASFSGTEYPPQPLSTLLLYSPFLFCAPSTLSNLLR